MRLHQWGVSFWQKEEGLILADLARMYTIQQSFPEIHEQEMEVHVRR